MADVQKYSLVSELAKKDEQLQGSPALRGMSGMTQTKYVNAMRTTMNTSHQKQFLNMLNAEFPYIFLGMENVAGKNSSGYKKAKNDLVVYKKIAKFSDELENPNMYLLFVYDKKKDKYDVYFRKPAESLTENFGYEYDNEVIDSYEEGDKIEKGTILYRSKSYDEDMNYGYGMNVTMMYTLDPFTAEDAAEASISLAQRMLSIETETITIGLNTNDYLLNLWGDEKEYKVLPPIGTIVNTGYICGMRRQYNSQLLYDFREDSLREIHSGDDVKFVESGTEIIDYTIYSNNENIERTIFNSQVYDMLKSQDKYYKAIHKTCKTIMESGSEYSRDIEYLFKRSREFLDNKKKWKEGDSAFSNMVIEVEVKRVSTLRLGQKIAGRYGNKSVISVIRPDDEMPITEDGRRVDLMFSLLGIINRTTSAPLYEIFLNSASYKLRRHMVQMNTLEEKANALFEYLKHINASYANYMESTYNDYTEAEKEQYIHDAIYDGIYIHQNDIDEDEPIFYKIIRLLNAYGNDWLKPDTLYLYNKDTGRDEKILNTAWVGEMYILKLKQSDRRGASIRSTGAVDITSLPTRNNKSKTHLERTSSTAIRFGEFESLNFSIGIVPEDIVLFHALYRTSPKARKALVKMMFDNDEDRIQKLPVSFTSQVASIFAVIFKSLGVRFTFIDDDNIVRTMDNTTQYLYDIEGETFLCTEYQAKIIEVVKRIEEEVMEDMAFMPTQDLCKRVNEILVDRGYIDEGVNIFDKDGEIDLSLIA